MANTRLSNPVIVTANNDVKPTNVNVTPSNGSDGKYTWACVGQKDTGSTSVITFSVNCVASGPQIAAGTTNNVYATCQAKASTTNYVQVTASFVNPPSNSTNWTIFIGGVGSGNYVRFVRGTGGGAVKKTGLKAAARNVAKPAAKKAAKKATKKAAKKTAKKTAKKSAAKKAAAKKPAKKAVAKKAAKKRK